MRLLAFGAVLVAMELVLRRFAPTSKVYRGWTAFFRGLGKIWTAVLLSVIYFVTVSVVSLVLRVLGKDLLDRSLRPEGTFWRAHEPHPLGEEAGARHQF